MSTSFAVPQVLDSKEVNEPEQSRQPPERAVDSPPVDRGRSRVRKPSDPFSEESLRRRGYHSLHSSFGKVFTVERRWSLIRELGSGAYGVVISAADKISGETVAIKLVTRVFDKIQLAKRALREITLLRHFANHENITGLIDVDAISPDFNEIYIFMEPMEADLHQIIKSGQHLTGEHVQYFLYQILRGMKYIHSASVVHRDLKPGNLLVNADCELKICDFGLSRGFDAHPSTSDPDAGDHATHLTEYVATRWYRAPEIMLAFRRYNTAIDVWSIGCIFAELLLGRPLFKGKDYVDQLNKILDVLGTPEERVITRIGSDKAQAYIRSLPIRKKAPFSRILPMATAQALDLITKMLTFDPAIRISVPTALEHPWLSAYHDEADEPSCPTVFDKWRKIESLETMDDFRKELWNEIEEYRREVRGMELSGLPPQKPTAAAKEEQEKVVAESEVEKETIRPSGVPPIPEAEATPADEPPTQPEQVQPVSPGEQLPSTTTEPAPEPAPSIPPPPPPHSGSSDMDTSSLLPKPDTRTGEILRPATPTDPVVNYARRSSILQPRRDSSYTSSPTVYHAGPAAVSGATTGQPRQGSYFTDTFVQEEPGPLPQQNQITFPSHPAYVVPARTRTASMAGDTLPRRLLRTLSTVSIHESAEGRAGGLADIAPIGKWILEKTSATGMSDGEGLGEVSSADEPEELAPEAGSSGKEKKFHL